MARQSNQNDMGFIEKHVEKLVLTAAAGLLLFAVSHWVLSSPRRVPLVTGMGRMTDPVRPEEADAAVLKAAQKVKRRHDRERFTVPPLPRIPDHLVALRTGPIAGDPMIAWGLPRHPLLPWVPKIGRGGKIGMGITVAELQELAPKPSAPVAQVYHELADTGPVPGEWYAAHPVATYSLTDLIKAWQPKLKLIILRSREVLPIAVEVEVRVAAGPDADWDAVEPRPATTIRLPGAIRDAQGEGVDSFPVVAHSCDEKTFVDVQKDLDLIANNLQELLQPAYYDILDDTGRQWISWHRNLSRGPLEEAGGEVLKIQRAIERRGNALPRRGGGRLPPRGAPPRGAPPRGAPPRGARPGRRITRPTVRPTAPTIGRDEPGTEPGAEPVVEEQVAPPAFDQQMAAGKILIWFHDNSLQPGRAYRYRIRLKLRNPLLGHAADMHKDFVKEAWLTTVNTPWSDWSKPIRAVRPINFFLVESKRAALRGPKANTGTIKVAVFTRRLGQLVAHEFVADKGQPIGRKFIKTLRNPPPGQFGRAKGAAGAAGAPAPAGELGREVEVDFSTGAVAINVNFSKAMFKAGQSIKTTELIYLDEKGQLQSALWIKNLPKESHKRLLYQKLKAEAAGETEDETGDEMPGRLPGRMPIRTGPGPVGPLDR